ncbi:hypothetical protein [Hydrogenophaga sp.]|uniref:hypothetical protein n=1 Tax=Hydrogenophaga sp. TaxID=1904254 RepID=UPI002616E8EA|nr:hypothetical protein [Hydrogenophaga sp.]MCW5653578.1 hypothetical protein [Hydrogenophaga sp.]
MTDDQKEATLANLAAASSANSALLMALFECHPQQKDVLAAFLRYANLSAADLIASPVPDAVVDSAEDAKKLWAQVLQQVIDNRN